MTDDPILAEIRAFREEYARRFNYDLRAIVKDLRTRQEESGRKIVLFARKPAQQANSAAKK